MLSLKYFLFIFYLFDCLLKFDGGRGLDANDDGEVDRVMHA